MLLSVSVQVLFFFLDVNECSYAEFNACPKQNTCVNLEGYYSCNPENEHADVNPQQLSSGKDGKKCRCHFGKHRESLCWALLPTAGATIR